MKLEQSFTAKWTDGGYPSNGGYFDGVGDFSRLLDAMFAGGDDGRELFGLPFHTDVMSNVRYGSEVKVTVIIETKEK